MSEPGARIGDRIRERRAETKLSISALADRAKVSKGYLWSLEKGETDARPSGRTLYKIAEALGTTMSDLLGILCRHGSWRVLLPGTRTEW